MGTTVSLLAAITPPLNCRFCLKSIYRYWRGYRTLLGALLPRHLENVFQFDRGAERKAGDAVYQTARVLVFSEDVLQQLRSRISDFRLIANISRSGHRDAEPDDPRHSVKRSQMVPRNSEDVERREVGRFAARFYIEFRADSPNERRTPAFRGKHPGQKKQIASLHSFRVCTERLRWCRKLDTKFSQPQFGAGGPGAFARYHLSTCATSTCSTSPVT